MKPLCANSPLLVGLLTVALISGCEKKKPVVPPPQAQAPAPAETPAPSSEATQQAQAPHPPSQGTPPPDPGQAQAAEEKPEAKPEAQPETQAAEEKTDKDKAKSVRSGTAKKPSPAKTARNTPPKIVVKPGGAEPSATPGQISPGSPNSDVSHDQANTEQLLQSSESNLSNIKRQLSPDEQAIVAQIRDYMTQSRQAIKENDLVRARNLALKAHLLSDDLAKRR
jgi:hypothetical protein